MPKNARPRHLQARVAFLSKAANFLAEQQFSDTPDATTTEDAVSKMSNTGLPLMLASQLRAVAKRSQIQMGQEIKRGICKVCSTPLLQGKTSTCQTINDSKGGKKPWANVNMITCLNCGTKKRYPVGAKRQQKRSQRLKANVIITGVSQDVANRSNAMLDAEDSTG